MKVHRRVLIPSPLLRSLTSLITRNRRKKVIEMRALSSVFWVKGGNNEKRKKNLTMELSIKCSDEGGLCHIHLLFMQSSNRHIQRFLNDGVKIIQHCSEWVRVHSFTATHCDTHAHHATNDVYSILESHQPQDLWKSTPNKWNKHQHGFWFCHADFFSVQLSTIYVAAT